MILKLFQIKELRKRKEETIITKKIQKAPGNPSSPSQKTACGPFKNSEQILSFSPSH
jgi:hypothetical protein